MYAWRGDVQAHEVRCSTQCFSPSGNIARPSRSPHIIAHIEINSGSKITLSKPGNEKQTTADRTGRLACKPSVPMTWGEGLILPLASCHFVIFRMLTGLPITFLAGPLVMLTERSVLLARVLVPRGLRASTCGDGRCVFQLLRVLRWGSRLV